MPIPLTLTTWIFKILYYEKVRVMEEFSHPLIKHVGRSSSGQSHEIVNWK